MFVRQSGTILFDTLLCQFVWAFAYQRARIFCIGTKAIQIIKRFTLFLGNKHFEN